MKFKCILAIVLLNMFLPRLFPSCKNMKEVLLNQPESVEYYETEKLYLVSNWASGEIIAIDSLNNQSYFNQELDSVAGIKIINNKLFCCNTDKIAIIDLTNRSLDTLIYIEGSSLLNDLVIYNNHLYISDYWDPKIYKLNLSDYSYEIFLEEDNFVPNGLFFDEENSRIIAVVRNSNGSQPRIVSINPDDAYHEVIRNTPYYSLDGISRDTQGNYYISSWYMTAGVEGIFRYNNDFSNEPEIISTNCSGPADIFIKNNILAIPNLNANTLDFIDLNPLSCDNYSTINNNYNLHNYPNPFNPETCISFELTKKELVSLNIYNVKGQLIKPLINKQMLFGKQQIRFRSDTLSSGIYFYILSTPTTKSVNKMLILK